MFFDERPKKTTHDLRRKGFPYRSALKEPLAANLPRLPRGTANLGDE